MLFTKTPKCMLIYISTDAFQNRSNCQQIWSSSIVIFKCATNIHQSVYFFISISTISLSLISISKVVLRKNMTKKSCLHRSLHVHWKLISWFSTKLQYPLQWRHNEPDGVTNHRHLDCLLNCLFRCKSKKTSKLCFTGLCEGNSPVTSP